MFSRTKSQQNFPTASLGVSDAEIVHVLDSSGLGGIESHVAAMTRAQTACGNQTSVALFGYGTATHPLNNALSQVGARFEAIGGTKNLYGWLLNRKRDSNGRGQTLLIHTHGYKAGVILRALCWLFRIPCVSTYHSGDMGTGRLRLYTALDDLTARLSPAIAVNQVIADRLGGYPTVVKNFVTMDGRQVCNPGSKIAFVGRLSHEKGPDIFCQTAEYALAHNPELQFEVFGDGPLRAELEALHGDRIRFRGAVPAMDPYWDDIGLLCMPSRAEGLPMAALEALSRGIPVVAASVGGLPDLLSQAGCLTASLEARLGASANRIGWLVPPEDPEGIVAAVLAWKAQSTAECQAMAQRCRARVSEGFSADIALTLINGVYRQALGRAAHRQNAKVEVQHVHGEA
ncbi:MAG: glycosyltransferase family 4 protein [Pseudomonadota bacterium]